MTFLADDMMQRTMVTMIMMMTMTMLIATVMMTTMAMKTITMPMMTMTAMTITMTKTKMTMIMVTVAIVTMTTVMTIIMMTTLMVLLLYYTEELHTCMFIFSFLSVHISQNPCLPPMVVPPPVCLSYTTLPIICQPHCLTICPFTLPHPAAPCLSFPLQASATLPESASSKAIEVWFSYTIARMFLVSMVHTAVYRGNSTVRAYKVWV